MAEIEIGFSNNIYNNPADVVGSVTVMSKDFRALEIELAEEARPAILDAKPADYARIVKRLRGLSARRRLGYSVHAAWYGPHTDLTSSDAKEREESVKLLGRAIQFAADIGAKIVTCHPGYRNSQTQRQVVRHLVNSLRRLEEITARLNVLLCVENMGAQRPKQTFLNNEELLEVCEGARVFLCLDVVHLASIFPRKAGLLKAVRALAPFVQHVHLADMIRPKHRHMPIGLGDLPLAEILGELKAKGFAGQAIVEEFNRGWTPEQYLEAAIEFRTHAQSLGIAR